MHLDNLKSRYITKDATFIESKDAVGETFRLFMHNDQFLCHEQGHGFTLFMLKDTPKRDTLNCAYNIVETTPTRNLGTPAIKQAISKEPSKDMKNAPRKSNGAKPVSQYIKDKTTGQSIPEFKDLVDAIKQQKDPFLPQQGGSLIAVLGPPKSGKPQPKKDAKEKAAQRKKLPELGVVKKKVAPIKQPGFQQGRKNAKDRNKMAKKGGNKGEKKANAPAQPQPVNDMGGSLFKMKNKYWFPSRPMKKVYISNPYLQNLQRQQLANNLRAFARQQAFANQQAFARQNSVAQQQMAMKRYQAFRMQPQLAKQVKPAARQIIDSLYPQPQLHATNVIGQAIQYVPPSQWNKVANVEPNKWIHDAKSLLNNQQKSSASSATMIAATTTNTYATDNLLTALHPELGLLHSAHHDVNEVLTTDPNIHHIDIQHSSERLAPIHVSTLPHETALHAGQISGVEPVGLVQHIELPSAVPIHDHRAAPLVVSMPQPSIVTSNAAAATELVHKNPDITLEEAFHKMEPLPGHPIEIGSETIHNVETLPLDSLHPDKAFHMRTHYVTGKAVDMNEEDQNTLKEVHVVHHNHHLVHAANEDEKQKFVSNLVDSVNDLCISLLLVNNLSDRYRLVSTLNPHGYRPKSKTFSLKTIFKEPKKRKVMSFKAYDEEDAHRLVLLNGHKELNIYPVSCANDPVKVTVDSPMKKSALVLGSKKNEVIHQLQKGKSCTQVTGGTSLPGSCCVFPFVFKGKSYNNCLPFDEKKGRTWCSLTSSFDKERRWGMCGVPNLPILRSQPTEEEHSESCPPTCTNECGSTCPMWCCTDASSSSLLH